MKLDIVAVDTNTQTISIIGDFQQLFSVGHTFRIVSNVGTFKGEFTVGTSTFNQGSGATTIITNELIDDINDSDFMLVDDYIITLSDDSTQLIVRPIDINMDTSLRLPGRGTLNYGDAVLENMVHLMEHFSSDTSPENPIVGQLWFNLNTDQLEVYTTTGWDPASQGQVLSVNGEIGNVVIGIADIGLSNVDNTSDVNKPVSVAQQTALNLKANIDSPTFTGVPTSPTASLGTNTEQIATTAFVLNELASVTTPVSHVGSTGDTQHGLATQFVAGFMSPADKTKVDNITGVNTGDQTNITGNAGTATKLFTPRTINGVNFDGSANITISASDGTKIPLTEKGAVNGVATLDGAGLVPVTQLPSYVDDVLEFSNLAGFPVTGETGKIYVAIDTNQTYRWSGSAYIHITSGAVDSVAGKTGIVTLVKADVGLSSVDNTSDINKPISTATQTALNLKANIASPVFTGNVTGLGVATGTSFNSITGLASSLPLVAGTAVVGTSTLAARQDHVHPLQTSIVGNADTATTLQTARTLTIGSTGKTFNGSANVTWSLGEIGASTVGSNIFSLTNPNSITFIRINADNTTSALSAADFRTAIGVGVGGSVNSVSGTAPISSSGGADPIISITPATTVLAGSMSAVDKTKLDGIASGANNYIHPIGDGNLHVPATGTINSGKVLTAGATAGSLSWETPASGGVTSVSGVAPVHVSGTTTPLISMAAASSGINGYMSGTYATKLDGIATGANNYVHPTGDGNLHVPATGTANNGKVLTAGATAGSLSWVTPSLATTGNYQIYSLGVGTPASGVVGEIRATNEITAYYSDERLKTIHQNIPDALNKIKSLRGIIYTNNETAISFGFTSHEEQVGVVAQEIQQVLPQAVRLAPFDSKFEAGELVSNSGENYLTVQYEKIIPLLIEAMKEQQTQIENLKEEVRRITCQ